MGGKREVRRCTSLMDDGRKFSDETRKISEDLLLRAEGLRKWNAQNLCPVTIHIDACTSDDDNDNVDENKNDRTINNTAKIAEGSVPNRHGHKFNKRHVTFLTANEKDVCDHVTLISTHQRDQISLLTDRVTALNNSNPSAGRPSTLNLCDVNSQSNTYKTSFLVSPLSPHSPLSPALSARFLPNSPTLTKRSSPKSPTIVRSGILPNSPTLGRQGLLNSPPLARGSSPNSPTLVTRQGSPNSPALATRRNSPILSAISASNFLEVPEECHLSLVKKATVRLNLRTRSSSFLEWRSKWLESPHAPPQFPLPPAADDADGKGEKLTEERKGRINDALQWLKSELREMQSMDQHLARQLLSLRHDIQQLRLRNSCQRHRDLLDDVQSEIEEQEEFSDVLDLPKAATLNDTPLKHLGVTRMNLSARRFSTC